MLEELCSWYPKTVPALLQMVQHRVRWEKYVLKLLFSGVF